MRWRNSGWPARVGQNHVAHIGTIATKPCHNSTATRRNTAPHLVRLHRYSEEALCIGRGRASGLQCRDPSVPLALARGLNHQRAAFRTDFKAVRPLVLRIINCRNGSTIHECLRSGGCTTGCAMGTNGEPTAHAREMLPVPWAWSPWRCCRTVAHPSSRSNAASRTCARGRVS